MSIEFDPRPDGEPSRRVHAWLDEVVDRSGESVDDVVEGERIARARGHVRALTWLTRHPAPDALEGRVVASQNNGFRQDRAVAFVQELAARRAPRELDVLLHPAPRELDDRVAHAVEDPPAFTVAAMTARLGRLNVPSELDGLVELAIAPAASSGAGSAAAGAKARPTPGSGIGTYARGAATLALALSVAVVVIAGWPRSAGDPASGESPRAADGYVAPEETVSLEFIRITTSDLSPSDKRAVLALGAPLVGGNS